MATSSTTFKKGVKGHPLQGKRGPDKVKQEAKDALAIFVSNNTEKFEDWISQVEDPGKRMDLVIKAMEFVRPKLARSDTHLSGSVSLLDSIKELDGTE